jgi:beta-lactamase class A
MIRDSDSIAADMLIRLMGEDNFNEHIEDRIVSNGVERITTILQVRYEAYSELHEKAANLTNLDIIKLKVTLMQDRLNEFVRMTSINKSELKVNSIPEAFERYYERGLNSTEPLAMGMMLEQLAEGEYLNEEHTDLLLSFMKGITTGDRRIKAGLPTGTVFAQKTGTQIGRAANLGIIYPANGKHPIIVAAFAEKFNDMSEAELALEKVGRLIAKNWLE